MPIQTSAAKNFAGALRRVWNYAFWGEDPTPWVNVPACLNSGTFANEYLTGMNAAGTGTVNMIGVSGANAVVFPSGATIPSGQTLTIAAGGNFVDGSTQVIVNIPLAQVLTLNSVGVPLLAAQGAGTLIEVLSCTIDLVFGSLAYSGGGAVGVKYGVGGSAASTTLAAATLTGLAANTVALLTGAIASVASSACLNTALVLQAATADFTGGTGGSAIVQLRYKVHTGLS